MSTHTHGRVDEQGNVYCTENGVERQVGQYPDVAPEEALAFFVRKFDDLNTSLSLLERRVKPGAHVEELKTSLSHIAESVSAGIGVGDFASLRQRVDALTVTLDEMSATAKEDAEKAREEALAHRTALVEKIEALAAGDLSNVQWKQMSAQVEEIFGEWQEAQRKDRRIPKSVADELWKRFRTARNTIDSARRHYFADLDHAGKAAKSAKEDLIKQAEALSDKGADGLTAYRELLEKWKKAPRASKKVEDALWMRFKAAGDVLYQAKQEKVAAEDVEFGANLEVKLALLDEAEALIALEDHSEARARLNALQKRWDAAGKVPRARVKEVEERMRKVEQSIKRREDDHWKSTDPEKQARSSGLAGQIEERIAQLEAELAIAQSQSDSTRVAELTEAIATQREWLTVL